MIKTILDKIVSFFAYLTAMLAFVFALALMLNGRDYLPQQRIVMFALIVVLGIESLLLSLYRDNS